jgi:hypothetical protein
MSEREIYLECLEFVRNQASGEWGEEIEKSDAEAMAKFVSGLISRLQHPTPTKPEGEET